MSKGGGGGGGRGVLEGAAGRPWFEGIRIMGVKFVRCARSFVGKR